MNFYGVAVADLSCFSEGAQQFLIWIGHFLVVSVILAPSKSNLCALLIAVSSLRGGLPQVSFLYLLLHVCMFLHFPLAKDHCILSYVDWS